jgi:hypothetical protein
MTPQHVAERRREQNRRIALPDAQRAQEILLEQRSHQHADEDGGDLVAGLAGNVADDPGPHSQAHVEHIFTLGESGDRDERQDQRHQEARAPQFPTIGKFSIEHLA